MQNRFLLFFVAIVIVLYSCKSGTVNLFKSATPHELYQRKLTSSGLDQTGMGAAWINTATVSNQKALAINLPFRETGYFPADRASASSYQFKVTRGQKLIITLSPKPVGRSMIYLDVWQLTDQGTKPLASADTMGNQLEVDIRDNATYLVRIQPELLQSLSYTIEMTTGPSLGFPTKTGRNKIGSYWGDGRDQNSRKHEGVDIFGNFRTPVVATSKG